MKRKREKTLSPPAPGDDDELYDLARLEELLGLRGADSAKNRRKLKKEFLLDGFDEDLLGLLDEIDTIVPSTDILSPPLDSIPSTPSSQSDGLTGVLNRACEGNLAETVSELTRILLTSPNPPGFATSLANLLATSDPSLTMLGVLVGLTTATARRCGIVYAATLLDLLSASLAAADETSLKFLGLCFSFGLIGVEVLQTVTTHILADQTAAALRPLATLLRFAGSRLKRECPLVLEGIVSSVAGRDCVGRRERLLLDEVAGFPKSAFPIMQHYEAILGWLQREAAAAAGTTDSNQVRMVDLGSTAGSGVFGRVQAAQPQKARKANTTRDQISALEEQAERLQLRSETQRALFVALMGAVNVEDAILRIRRVNCALEDTFAMLCFCAVRESGGGSFFVDLAGELVRQVSAKKAGAKVFRETLVKELHKCEKYKIVALRNLGALLRLATDLQIADLAVLRFSKFSDNTKIQTELVVPLLRHVAEHCSLEQQLSLTSTLRTKPELRDCQLALAVLTKQALLQADPPVEAAHNLIKCILGC